MKRSTIFGCCLSSAAAAFYAGLVSAALLSTTCTTQGDKPRDPPPAGEQFDEGPVLVRLPGASTSTTRFIF